MRKTGILFLGGLLSVLAGCQNRPVDNLKSAQPAVRLGNNILVNGDFNTGTGTPDGWNNRGWDGATPDNFSAANLTGIDIAVVCLTSAYDTAYSAQEASLLYDYVVAGGSLLIMADLSSHPNSNILPVAQQFGIEFGTSDLAAFDMTNDLETHNIFLNTSEVTMYGATELTFTGPDLAVAGLLNDGATLWPRANRRRIILSRLKSAA